LLAGCCRKDCKATAASEKPVDAPRPVDTSAWISKLPLEITIETPRIPPEIMQPSAPSNGREATQGNGANAGNHRLDAAPSKPNK
jgi:hypothetical protein